MTQDCVSDANKQEYTGGHENATEGNLSGSCAIHFTVFGKPVGKQRPRVMKGYAYTPKETVEQEKNIVLLYKSIYHDFMFGIHEPVRLEVDFYLEITKTDRKKKKVCEKQRKGLIRPTKKIDIDNGLKLVQDALNKVAYYDDSQIVEICGRKFYSDKPRTEIRISRVQCDAV